MKKFLVFMFTLLLVSFNVYAADQVFQDFTSDSLHILEKTYKYKLADSEEGASFSEILKYFPHLKLRDDYDLKYFSFQDMAGVIRKLYALKNGEAVITDEQWRMNPEIRDKLLPPIEGIQISENTDQAKQELAIFQMVIDTLFWSNHILFLEAHKKELLAKTKKSDSSLDPSFSWKEKSIIKKAYVTPMYKETSTGFKVKFLLFHDFGAASLGYITYEFIKNEDGTWKVVKDEEETLFSQPRRYII